LNLEEQVIQSLEASLNIRLDRSRCGPDAPLLGAIPEFDSMAVVALLANLEERFSFTVDDDEVDGSTFATIGSLTHFVRGKTSA
jgi:acyl carrier protein